MVPMEPMEPRPEFMLLGEEYIWRKKENSIRLFNSKNIQVCINTMHKLASVVFKTNHMNLSVLLSSA